MQKPADLLAPSPIEDDVLCALVPIGSLPSALRATIAGRAMVYDLVAGGRFEGGDSEMAGSLYLMQGRVSLVAPGRAPVPLQAGDEAARSALAGLAGDGAYLVADEDCRLLQVDGTLLASLLTCVASGADIADEPWLPRVLASEPFSALPPAGLYQLGSRLQRVSLAAGEYVLQQDETTDYYYLLASGRCAVEWRSGVGEEAVELATIEPGDGFGEEALLGDLPRATSVRTVTPCVLRRLTRADFEALMQTPRIDRCKRADADRRVAEGAFWLDVRLPAEHEQGAPAGSVNVPLGALGAAMEWLDRDSEWIVCCNTGLRSEAAVTVLAENGYRALQLDGGLFGREGRGGEQHALGELERRRAHADAEVETALQETAIAQAAVAMPSYEGDPEAATEPSPELQKAAEQARARLDEAIRSKLYLDTRARHIEADISARRERALAETARLRTETEQRLREERDRLSSEVAEAASAMQALRTERKAAEARFTDEQRELTERVNRARQELESQARRIREEMLKARHESEGNLQRIRTEHGNSERDMLRSAETKLREQRGRLQAEFARCVQVESDARVELDKVEQAQRDARRAAEQERSRLRSEAESRRAQRAEEKRVERERLDARALDAERRMHSAERQSAQSQARSEDLRRALEETSDKGVGGEDDDQTQALNAELASHESEAQGAASELREARAVLESANRAKWVAETRIAQEDAAEVELRVKLYEELEEALAAEHLHPPPDKPRNIGKTSLNEPRSKTNDEDEPLPDELLAEIESQLADESAGDTLRAQFVAQRSQLTQAALAAAAQDKARAREDLERARAHLAQLRQAATGKKTSDG